MFCIMYILWFVVAQWNLDIIMYWYQKYINFSFYHLQQQFYLTSIFLTPDCLEYSFEIILRSGLIFLALTEYQDLNLKLPAKHNFGFHWAILKFHLWMNTQKRTWCQLFVLAEEWTHTEAKTNTDAWQELWHQHQLI